MLVLLCVAGSVSADPLKLTEPSLAQARREEHTGLALMGVGTALTMAGSGLLGYALHSLLTGPPSDSAGPGVFWGGMVLGSAWVVASGLAALATGTPLYVSGVDKRRRLRMIPGGFAF